jgi:thiamine phosphate synthase YjbQ (UPF0047 family)
MNAAVKILTQTQAETIYATMCALNKIDALVRVEIDSGDISVQQHHKSGRVVVNALHNLPHRRDFESYLNQRDFATAYGLSADS